MAGPDISSNRHKKLVLMMKVVVVMMMIRNVDLVSVNFLLHTFPNVLRVGDQGREGGAIETRQTLSCILQSVELLIMFRLIAMQPIYNERAELG